MKSEILLIGGGGHCKAVIDVIEQEDKYEIVGIIDKKELVGRDVCGYKVVGSDEELQGLFGHYKYAIVTVGQIKSPDLRIKIFSILKTIGYHLPTVISPLAYVSKYAKVGEGSIVMHHALVNTNAIIGRNCIINTKALIEHDVVIEDNCHISTAAVVNGGVLVREGTFFGSNAVAREYVEVDGFIKAGSVAK